MKASLVQVAVFLAIISISVCLSPWKSSEDQCGPTAPDDSDDCDCYPAICSDSTVIEADYQFKTHANITIDTGNGKCTTSGNTPKRKCTANDKKFKYFVDWDYDNPQSYSCSTANTFSMGPSVDVNWEYKHVTKTYTVRALYCHRTETEKLCCSSPFIKQIEAKA